VGQYAYASPGLLASKGLSEMDRAPMKVCVRVCACRPL